MVLLERPVAVLAEIQVRPAIAVEIGPRAAACPEMLRKSGGGAYLDGEAIEVSRVGRLEDAYLSTTTLRVPRPVHELAARAAVARTYPDFWQHVLVAEGRVDVAIDLVLEPWDWKAPKLIVEEAGGRFTTEPGLYVSSNRLLHDPVLRFLEAHEGE